MTILWIVQKDLTRDLDVATWIEMSRALAQRSHRVILVTRSTSRLKYKPTERNWAIKAIRVINRFPFMAITFHLQILLLGLYWLVSLRPEVIICHPLTAPFLWPAKLFSKLYNAGCKFVLDIRTLPVRNKTIGDKIKNSISSYSIASARLFFDGITVVSSMLKRIVAEQYRIQPERIGIWTSGVDVDRFQPKNNRNKSARADDEKFTVMYHGVIAPNRGLFETVEAMALVNQIFPNIGLFILGQGLALDDLLARVEQANLKSVVQFHKKVSYDEIPAYIARANVGIIPLPDEPCWQVSSPLKLFEYLAMARPVIVSPIEAHVSVLKNCPAVVFLQSTSPADIAAGIVEAYENRDRLRRLALGNRKYVATQFTWQQQALELERFVTTL